MSVRPKLYLAGPDVFAIDAPAIGRRKKALCADYGFEGLFPFDNEVSKDAGARDRQIYRANIAMLRAADGGIFDLSPFRGVSADVGTVFELGVMVGMGRPVFAYTKDGSSLRERLERRGEATFDEASHSWRDAAGCFIEEFGNLDNLMIDAAVREQGNSYLIRPQAGTADDNDLTGFIASLARAADHFGLGARRDGEERVGV